MAASDKDHKLVLKPSVEMPASEKWLFDNQTALAKVKRGLDDTAAGQLNDASSFAKYADDEIE